MSIIKSKYGYSVWEGPKTRWLKFLFQRLTRGWDDSEVWNFDQTIAQFILPRLRRLKQIKHGYPSELTEEQWSDIMDEMILAFSLVSYGFNASDEDSEKHVETGLDFFHKYFFNLWD